MEDHRPTQHLPSAPTSQPTTKPPSERRHVAAILARLSLHYWRPDFTPEQAKLLIEDYLDDLAGFSPTDIERAIMEYRRKPDSQFFPKSGQLLAILKPPRPAYDGQPRSRLPKFRSSEFLLAGPKPKLKSVGDVLRQHGYGAAAERYEARKCKTGL